jgi:peptidoglycan/xylan/chitin deacetylase (PgdA/CDA1 family)
MHPGLWERTDPESFNEFEKCVDYLIEQGAVFMTPYEYYNYITR